MVVVKPRLSKLTLLVTLYMFEKDSIFELFMTDCWLDFLSFYSICIRLVQYYDY